jgi:hypothetical protein
MPDCLGGMERLWNKKGHANAQNAALAHQKEGESCSLPPIICYPIVRTSLLVRFGRVSYPVVDPFSTQGKRLALSLPYVNVGGAPLRST